MSPKVSIVIVNWNTLEHTAECLESLKSITYPNYRVIVVDNGSVNNDAKILAERYNGFIELLLSERNIGFAGGSNMGIKRALQDQDSAYVLLLNNDTVVDKEFLTELVATAESCNAVGIVGGKIFYYDDPEKVWYAGGRMDLIRGNAYHVRDVKTKPDINHERDVSFITGCLMLVRRSLFSKIGLLPEEYFLSVEDTDFCYRAMRAGYRLKVNSRSHIMHKVSAARGGENTPLETYYLTRNRLYFMFSTVGKFRYLIPFTLFFALSRAVKAFKWALELKAPYVKAIVAGTIDSLRGRMGRCPKDF